MNNLDENDKRTAVNFAMTIECGLYPLEKVIELTYEKPAAMTPIIEFWLTFNSMTRAVAGMVINERLRAHCENCYELGAVEPPPFNV